MGPLPIASGITIATLIAFGGGAILSAKFQPQGTRIPCHMIELLSYQALLTIHLTSFTSNVVCVLLADTYGLLWMLGKRHTLNTPVIRWLHWGVWIGLAVSIVSGFALFTEASSYLLSQPAFLVKVGFVCVLFVNSFVISHHLRGAAHDSWQNLTARTKRNMLISAGVSFMSWVAVIALATQLGL